MLPSWFALAEHDSLASTNDEAKRMANEEGGADGALVWAHVQTAGRGRQNRLWISAPGNLFCSVLLRPTCAPARAAEIGFVVPLAGIEALESLSNNLALSLKWPNDILAAGKKIGGILMESSLRGGGVDWVVAGLGLNLASHPDGAEFPATSLKAAAGVEAAPADALIAFCTRFEHWYGRWQEEGFAPIREAWLAKPIRWEPGSGFGGRGAMSSAPSTAWTKAADFY
jgi:BirA family biotin operon repressor/biotin-[acetyl-CoA-carboxylase] ligase